MHPWDEFEFREETRDVSETLYRKFPMLADNEIIREMLGPVTAAGIAQCSHRRPQSARAAALAAVLKRAH
jgi:hypothetical protein